MAFFGVFFDPSSASYSTELQPVQLASMAASRVHSVASARVVRVCGLPAAAGLCAVLCREDLLTIVYQSAHGSVVLRYHSGGCGGDHECDDTKDLPVRERVWAVQLPDDTAETLLGIRAEDHA